MEIIGKEIQVGFGVEETRGTPQGTAEKWMRKVVANIVERAEKAIDDASRGNLADADNSRVVKKFIEGDMEGIVQVDAVGYLLYNIYGAVNSSLVGSGVYDHTFSLSNTIQHASLTLFTKDGSVQQLALANCMLKTLTIEGSVDDYVRFKASFLGSTAIDNADSPSYDTEYDFVGKDITIKMADSEAGLSGATAMKVKDFSITFDQGVVADHVLGVETPDDNYNTKMSIEGEMTLNFADQTLKDLYLGDSAKYMKLEIKSAVAMTGSYYPTITLILNKVKIQDWNRSGGNDELVTEVVTFKAFYNATDSEQSTLVLRNMTSEYSSPISA